MLPEFPLEKFAASYLTEAASAEFEPTGVGKDLYLDVAERIVRDAAAWQDESGRIRDPVTGEEFSHATPRYAAALAPLIAMGRCQDMLSSCARCMDATVQDLAAGERPGLDFFVRDAALILDCIGDRVPPEKAEEWRRLLTGYDPEKTYVAVLSKRPPDEIHNFAIYHLAGEWMKMRLGCGDSRAHVERYLDNQERLFTAYGMYRDPNCPMTYDLAVRQNLALLVAYDYDGPHRALVEEVFRRGALTQLFYQSSSGEAPCGGRSNQFHHLEGMFCCAAELAASRHAREGRGDLAGAFKRAARRAALSTVRWQLDATPFRHIKNMFPWAAMHGCDSYGGVSVYGLLAANLFALAGRIADDDIAELAAPCDVGGHVLSILDGFHRIWACCGPLHVQVDLNGQREFDATGLCRVHHRDHPTELALSCGIARAPKYTTAEPPVDFAAIGPCWKDGEDTWHSLAATQPSHFSFRQSTATRSEVNFAVDYTAARQGGGEPRVREEYALTPADLTVHSSVERGPIRFIVPLILTDGDAASRIEAEPHGFAVHYRGSTLEVAALHEGVRARREGVRAPNRNGVYDLGVFERDAPDIRVRLRFRAG